MKALIGAKRWIKDLADDSRAAPIAFTCIAFLSVILGAQARSIDWIGATLAIDLAALLLWGRPVARSESAVVPAKEQERLQRLLESTLASIHPKMVVECVLVEGEPFPEAATTLSRSNSVGTIYVRLDRLSTMTDVEIRVVLFRELVHLSHRHDVRRWFTNVMTLFLLVVGSAALALLRLCLGSRLGAVDMVGAVAACFVGVPTAIFLLQYVLHEIEFQADREVVAREPALLPALIEFLKREDVDNHHPFVVIPYLAPVAAERIEHLNRMSHPPAGGVAWKALMRPLSAFAALALLGGVVFAVANLMNGRVPDVTMNASPANTAREAIAAAQAVQLAVETFSPSTQNDRQDLEVRVASSRVDGLRRQFERLRLRHAW